MFTFHQTPQGLEIRVTLGQTKERTPCSLDYRVIFSGTNIREQNRRPQPPVERECV